MSGDDSPRLRSAVEIALERAERIAQEVPDRIVVMQIGGSAIRDMLSSPDPYGNFRRFLNNGLVVRKRGILPVYTTGGGFTLSLVRYYDKEFHFAQDVYDEMYFHAVCLHAKIVACLLGAEGEYLLPKDLPRVDRSYLRTKTPVFSHIDDPWNLHKPFSADLQALKLANHFGCESAVMFRDVDAIYQHDPKADSFERLEAGARRREEHDQLVEKQRRVVPQGDINVKRRVRSRKRFVVKIGGSGFDVLYYKRAPLILIAFLREVVRLHRYHDFIITVGGGPSQDIVKRFRDHVTIDAATYADASYHALLVHGLLVAALLEYRGELIRETDIAKITPTYLREKIPVVTHVPGRLGETIIGAPIPRSESDAQTNALAEHLQVEEIIYAKNTPGIFPRDPNIEPVLPPEAILPAVSVDELRVLSRVGEDGHDEHLIENLGLTVFEHSTHVQRVRVIDINQPSMLATAVRGATAGSVIHR
jgi:uridylate kinase